MHQIELSAGTIDYEDVGEGPPIVLLHGLLMDSSLWRDVVAELGPKHRCLVPTLPMGAHRTATNPGADLSMTGVARLVNEFLERLGLEEVTLVGVDTGGAIVQLMICEGVPRVARVVLGPCDAFDNFPPGLPGRALFLTAKLPPRAFGLFMQQMRARPIRRLPIAFGWLTRRGDQASRGWLEPILRDNAIRRDIVRLLRAAAKDKKIMSSAAECLGSFAKPVLIAWASEDRVMPPEHGQRLSRLLPQARLVEIADSYTLLPLDQPEAFARAIADFAAG